MKNPEMLPHFVNDLKAFKETSLWEYLTADALHYSIISLMLLFSFFLGLYFLGYIQLIKQSYQENIIVKSAEIQKIPTEEITIPANELEPVSKPLLPNISLEYS